MALDAGAVGDETWQRLGAAAQLLHHAAAEVWSDADQTAPDFALHAFGLAVYLAHAKEIALLPEGHELPHVDLESAPRRSRLPRQRC